MNGLNVAASYVGGEHFVLRSLQVTYRTFQGTIYNTVTTRTHAFLQPHIQPETCNIVVGTEQAGEPCSSVGDRAMGNAPPANEEARGTHRTETEGHDSHRLRSLSFPHLSDY